MGEAHPGEFEEDPEEGTITAEKNKAERANDRKEFEEKLRTKLVSKGLTLKEMGKWLMANVSSLQTKFGNFKEKLDEGAVEKVKASGPAAHDLLPISVESVWEADFIEDAGIRGWATFSCLCLNFWYCAGWDRADHLEHPRELTGSQKDFLLYHLIPAVERMLEGDPRIPRPKELEKLLSQKGQDYEGNSWVVMEQLESEKVVKCWPEKGKAAVQPLTRFLEGETKALVESPMDTILPYDQWPSSIPNSYVRATDEEWNALISEGYKRGLFQYCPEEEVLAGPNGEKVLNGAGAVPKEKDGQMLQRFISIFCPLNAVSRKIEGQEDTLPYVGQVCLLNLPDDGCVLIDSEDLQSAFNLFEMPQGWRGLFCYQKQVPGTILGLATDDLVYVSLRTVPMGWISAVGVVQAAIRYVAFKEANLPLEGEIQKNKPLPEGDKFLLYLDSVDQIRPVSQAMAKVLEGTGSEEHQRLTEACDRLGLPRNEAKTLAGALHGSIQGGELRGDEGVFTLQIKKMQLDAALFLWLMTQEKWNPKRTSGIIGRFIFAGAFRRPLLAGFAEIFRHFGQTATKVASNQCFDEVMGMLGLLPFAFTNIKSPVNPYLHATDASPTGAGSCVARQIKSEPGACNPSDLLCGQCRKDMSELMAVGEEVDCPKKCGGHFCSLRCYLAHRDLCPLARLGVPVFSERWSGPKAPLTEAMLRQGFDVLPPFDKARGPGMDFFTEEGKSEWAVLAEEDPDYEHHAPDCKTMSRARGKPFYINGKYHRGPPALRDERHVMGFPHLKGQDAVRVRQGNKMALASIKRCEELDDAGKYFTLEHPYRSFIWYMKATMELAARPNVRMAVFSSCCYGGRRAKWTAVLTNNVGIYEALHQPVCPHFGEDYQPYMAGGRVIFPTEEEAQYPMGLCTKYAQGAAAHLGLAAHVQQAHQLARLQAVEADLAKYHKCEDLELRQKMALEIIQVEERMVAGQERQHLEWLLTRGSDIRLAIEHCGAKHLVPYPAGRWLWRDVLSFRWKTEAHINVLEAQAFFAHVRRILRDPLLRSCRLVVVVDSQVLFYAVGKGRSPSTQLNRVLRRLMPLLLAADVALFPLWTISAWNWADKPSRRAK